MKVKTLALLLPLFASSAFAAPLQLDVYNPQEKGIFPVSSTLVSGPKEAILFDAQFSTKDGEQLVQMIRASGKTLFLWIAPFFLVLVGGFALYRIVRHRMTLSIDDESDSQGAAH